MGFGSRRRIWAWCAATAVAVAAVSQAAGTVQAGELSEPAAVDSAPAGAPVESVEQSGGAQGGSEQPGSVPADDQLAGGWDLLADLDRHVQQTVADWQDNARKEAERVHAEVTAGVDAVREAVLDSQQSLGPALFDAPVVLDPQGEGPNYHWRSDWTSQMLAGRMPGSGPVLHRVPGSYFDAEPIPADAIEAQERGKVLMGAGTPIYVGTESICTLTVVGNDEAGRRIGLTAGHCGNVGDPVLSADSWQLGPAGTVVAKDPGENFAVVELGSQVELTNAYGGMKVSGAGGQAIGQFEQLCKKGVATGYTCGVTWTSQPDQAITQLCAGAGDSGGPVVADGRVVGSVTGGVLPVYALSCQTPLQGAAYMPTIVTPLDPTLHWLDGTAEGTPGRGFRIYER